MTPHAFQDQNIKLLPNRSPILIQRDETYFVIFWILANFYPSRRDLNLHDGLTHPMHPGIGYPITSNGAKEVSTYVVNIPELLVATCHAVGDYQVVYFGALNRSKCQKMQQCESVAIPRLIKFDNRSTLAPHRFGFLCSFNCLPPQRRLSFLTLGHEVPYANWCFL